MKDVALASLQSVPFCPPDRASSRSLSREAGGSLGSIVVTFPDVENYPIVSGHLEHGSLTTALSIVLPRKMEAVPPPPVEGQYDCDCHCEPLPGGFCNCYGGSLCLL